MAAKNNEVIQHGDNQQTYFNDIEDLNSLESPPKGFKTLPT